MTNLVPTNIEVPAHLAGRVGQPSALAESLGGGLGTGGETFPRISIKASRFRIVDGGAETVLDDNTIEVVVVGANPRLSKAWYAEKWTQDAEPKAPDCSSLDGVSPSPESESPQNDLCATCPNNAWGSRVTDTGTKVKACSDKKRLAIVAATDPNGPVYLLEVTAAALKGLNAYQRELSMRGIAPEIVKTAISFDTSASFPKLQFKFGGFIDEVTQGTVDGLFGSDRVRQITGEVSANIQIAAPTPAPAPTPVAAPAPVAEVVEPVAEPAAPPASASFGKPAAPAPEPVVAPTPEPAPVAEEPAPAPVADAGSAALADEISALMAEVADDD